MCYPTFRSPLFCSFEDRNSGAENLALGNSTIASWHNRYAIFYNPAGIQHNEKVCFSSTFRNYYGIKSINQVTAVSIFSLYSKKFSIGFERFGNNLYQENRIIFGFAFAVIKSINIGINIGYHSLEIAKYGRDDSFNLSIGFLYQINQKISLGLTVSDLYQPGLAENREDAYSNSAIGFAYIPLNNLTLYSTISHELRYPIEYKFGLEYSLKDYLLTRLGYEDSFDTISFGFGLEFISLTFNYALRWHVWLGASHAISLEMEI